MSYILSKIYSNSATIKHTMDTKVEFNRMHCSDTIGFAHVCAYIHHSENSSNEFRSL